MFVIYMKLEKSKYKLNTQGKKIKPTSVLRPRMFVQLSFALVLNSQPSVRSIFHFDTP